MATEPVLFEGGPVDGITWQDAIYHEYVRIPIGHPGDDEAVYRDTGEIRDGVRVYRHMRQWLNADGSIEWRAE